MVRDEPQQPHSFEEPPDEGVSVQTVLFSIRRHRRLFIAVALTLASGGLVVGLGLPDRFQAEAVLVVHSRPQRVTDIEEVLPDPATDIPAIRSEVDVLKSRPVIADVVRSLALWSEPEFHQASLPGGWNWATLAKRLTPSADGAASSSERSGNHESRSGADAPLRSEIDQTIQAYARHLTVQTDGHSMTIRVLFKALDPDLAAKIVNAHVQSFQRLRVEAKLLAAARANSWLTARVAELQGNLETAETAVSSYREQHNLTEVAKDSPGLSWQLASLNSQLIVARADLAENQARAAKIAAVLRTNSNLDAAPEVLSSPTIQNLRGQEALLVQQQADLKSQFGDRYPSVQNVRSRLRDLRAQITREIERSYAGALETVERSRARAQSIEQGTVELTKRVNVADAGLQRLGGNAESIRVVLHSLQKRQEETAADPALIISNSSLVSPADVADVSTFPMIFALAGLGGTGGILLGGLLALILERRDKTFRTSTQVEQLLGLRTIGAMPHASRLIRRSPADLVLKDSRSVFAEALRIAWASMQLTIRDPRRLRVGRRAIAGSRAGTALGVTSATANEGKSTYALALAQTAALAGEKVVLIDADLRRSGATGLLRLKPRLMLNDYFQGICTIGELIAAEVNAGMFFIPSTPTKMIWTNRELRKFVELVFQLKKEFGLVVIDLPPVLGLAETVPLALAAENLAIVIRWGRTKRQLVQFALDALRDAGILPNAVILNDVDIKAQLRCGYRDRTVVYELYEKNYA
jgi:polysaccharide biosynthesis transport protein